MSSFTNNLRTLFTEDLKLFKSIMIDVGLVYEYSGEYKAYLEEELKHTSEPLQAVLKLVINGSKDNLDNIIKQILGDK